MRLDQADAARCRRVCETSVLYSVLRDVCTCYYYLFIYFDINVIILYVKKLIGQ